MTTLTKTSVVDQIEIISNGDVQIREAVIIKEDNVEISRTFHRRVIIANSNSSVTDAVQALLAVISGA